MHTTKVFWHDTWQQCEDNRSQHLFLILYTGSVYSSELVYLPGVEHDVNAFFPYHMYDVPMTVFQYHGMQERYSAKHRKMMASLRLAMGNCCTLNSIAKLVHKHCPAFSVEVSVSKLAAS